MKLYRITTRGLGDYYVIANDPTEATTKLAKVLNAGDGYGFYDKRKPDTITHIADECLFVNDRNSFPFLLGGDAKLIINP